MLDSGGGSKLERFGDLVLIRPEPHAIWDRGLTESEWRRVSAAEFVPTGRTKGHWEPHQSVPDNWEIRYPLSDAHTLHISLELTRFKHVGLFPEQAANWRWMADRLGPGKRVLNLFAYPGGASLAARATGAEVTHLIVMDPPAWGLGPKGEKWKLEEQVGHLIRSAAGIVAPGGSVIMNAYSGMSPSSLENFWRAALPDAAIEAGELCLRSGTGQVLPTGSLVRVTRV